MSPVLAWWDRLPSAARWIIGLVYSVVTTATIFGLVAWAGPSDWSSTSVVYVGALVGLMFLPLGMLAQAHRLGGWRQWNLYRRAYSSGNVPPDADLERWRPIARRNLRYFRQGRVLQRVVLLILLVVSLVTGIAVVVVEGPVGIFALVATVILSLATWAFDRLWRWRVGQFTRFVAAIDGAENSR